MNSCYGCFFSKFNNIFCNYSGKLFFTIIKYNLTKLIFLIKVQNFGSLFWFIKTSRVNVDIQSLNKIPSTQKEDFSKLFHFLLDRGIYLAPSGFEVGFLSTAHTLQDIDDLVDQIKKFLAN